jgi:lipopolysaccharide/colanic/teichoic acid biosynthesis glycosyltransferase
LSTGALDPVELTAPATPEERLGAAPDVTERHARRTWVDVSCRTLDLIVALAALVILSPVLLLLALVVKLESSGPAIFSQERVGKRQRRFTLHKFRTVSADASHDRHRKYIEGLYAGEQAAVTDGGPRFKLAHDPRITRVGPFLRRSSLDELPQLWNVIRGEMSLVGPRPPIDYEVASYPAPHWFTRFDVKPGLTGLWQVSGRCDLTVDQMIALDIQYVQRRSLRLNLIILLRTLPAVLASRGAS